MAGIVFKQRYRSRNMQGTPGLNARHVHYIATRPGTVYNPGCGFGLWGKLPGNDCIRIQTDLERVEQIIKERSVERTMYRVVISVGKEDAEHKGMYHRENWEQLVNDHIGVIAKQMEILPKDFCWCASMHYKQDHPHVHIVYWDNGSSPRPESIPKPVFEKKAEFIRAAFSKALYHEEILEQQKAQKEQTKQMRLLIQSMCREANPEKGLNITRLYRDGTLEKLTEKMEGLIRSIPAKGSLRYAYVPPSYKALVDDLVKTCLDIPEFRKELEQYERCTRQIAKLYGNSLSNVASNWSKAYDKLHRELANEVLRAVVGIQKEIRQREIDHPRPDLRTQVFEQITPNLDSFQRLQARMPHNRIPSACMEHQIPGFRDGLNDVVQEILSDARIRIAFEAAALAAAGIDLTEKPDASADCYRSADHSPALFGKQLSDDELIHYRAAHRQMQSDLKEQVKEKLREQAGWNREAEMSHSMNMLCSMFHLLGQIVGQQRGHASWKRLYSKDKSKDAKKNLRASKPNDDWERDFD